MKMRLFGVLCLIVLVLVSSMIPMVNATITKEYEEKLREIVDEMEQDLQ